MQDPNLNQSDRTYVLVRGDIPVGYQMAQAIHAATELALAHPEACRAAPTVLVLEVANEELLMEWLFELHPSGSPVTVFQEPDLWGHPGGWHTAVAHIPVDGSIFADLPLAGSEPAGVG